MVRKIIVLLVFFVSAFLLTSCFFGGGRVLTTFEPNIADARMEKILDALENGNKEDLKAMFSEQALEEATDFDESMEFLFDYFQGDVQSWERRGWGSSNRIEYGKKSLMLRSWYTVVTDNGEYKVFVIDYHVDTRNPRNEGLYTLRIVHVDDEHRQTRQSWQDMWIPGIYIIQ